MISDYFVCVYVRARTKFQADVVKDRAKFAILKINCCQWRENVAVNKFKIKSILFGYFSRDCCCHHLSAVSVVVMYHL